MVVSLSMSDSRIFSISAGNLPCSPVKFGIVVGNSPTKFSVRRGISQEISRWVGGFTLRGLASRGAPWESPWNLWLTPRAR